VSDDTIRVSTKFKDGIPAATYPATVKSGSLEFRKDYGYGMNDYIKLSFSVEGPDKDIDINWMATQTFTKKAKATATFAALFGRPVKDGESISLSDIYGKRCLVTVTLDDETGYNKIVAVLPPSVERVRPQVPE
jgi:hypothetical protein